jgi:hypothetical protein
MTQVERSLKLMPLFELLFLSCLKRTVFAVALIDARVPFFMDRRPTYAKSFLLTIVLKYVSVRESSYFRCFMMEVDDIAAKLKGLEPGLMTMPETLALAEKALLEMLCDESTAGNNRIKAIELVFQKHQVGSPEERKPMATKEDFEHLRGVITEVKEVLEGHVGFYERKFARSTEVGPTGTS